MPMQLWGMMRMITAILLCMLCTVRVAVTMSIMRRALTMMLIMMTMMTMIIVMSMLFMTDMIIIIDVSVGTRRQIKRGGGDI